MEKRDGFIKITIPAQSYNSCSGCNFYECSMMRTGRNPEFKHHCKHSDAPHGNAASLVGNLTEEDHTPNWCPFLKKDNEQKS